MTTPAPVPQPPRPATAHDLPQVVDLHMAAFPTFFLSSLGSGFLRLMYLEMIEHETGILLVADEGGRIIGLIGGTMRQTGFYRTLVRDHLWRFAWAAASAAVRRPSIVPRLLRALRRPREASESAAEACLMSLAVRPDAGRQGIGRTLVDAFCCELVRRGSLAVCLTTDKLNNDGVNRFYRNLGFQIAREYTTPEGRAMCEYAKKLV